MTLASLFFGLELDVYQPATSTQPYAYGRGSHPRGALTMLASAADSSDTLRASDKGYRTLSTDPSGVQVYPAVMDQAFEIDRQVSLEPSQASTATFGAVRLSNLGQRYDTYTQARNCDSRSIKLLLGQKTFDAARGISVDPAYASLQSFFGGFAAQWQLSEEELEIPLKDGTYWADRPIQSSTYSGLGGLGGTSSLAGLPIPMTRGGTVSNPVQNVPLVTVDPVNLIYQWTDAPGTVVALYEGGAAVFLYDGDVADLYSGSIPVPGHYRTNNATGVLQMGSSPVRALTADVTGRFPVAGAITTAAALARYVLTETMAQPTSLLDLTSFAAVDAAYPYGAGFYVGTTVTSGLSVVQKLLGSVGGRMISGRNGLIKAFALRPVPTGATPVLKLAPTNVVAVTPEALPSSLDPPPYRWRVGYGQNYSVQTSDFAGSVTANRKTFLANEFRVSAWSSSAVLTAWRRPNDPAVVDTYLTSADDAQALASAQGALWQSRPDIYAVEVPVDIAAGVDIGSVVTLSWPLRGLTTGAIGQVVGEQVRSYDATCTLSVLMGQAPASVTILGNTADNAIRTADNTVITADAA